ncbi:hypothetical protein [Ancylomarina sp. 16SWW S1-10-2]|uniref:hypothetical protein n=1 Tax=Ancylomarina sp. 16SWW S1-10-2 TaxID=2499681 RepID=UPI0012AE5381|nr:hypothetical protein [Ancylomarina sp. 16SWW S1-10-2]MRT92381.1 hypothetical protein [Ancylomarina sp. 16SWW S1-10-2]
MPNISKKESVGFQLNKITTEQFAVIKDSYDGSEEGIGMSIELKFGLDFENKLIASHVMVQYEQHDKPFLIIEIANHFKIEETAWSKFSSDNDKMIIPKGFASHLVVLTIGTVRGVLHSKTENTDFNKFLLPTINVTKLIQEDVELT